MYKTTVSTLLLFFFLLNVMLVQAQNDHHSNHLLIKFEPSANYQDIQHLKNLYHADEIWLSFPSQMRLWEVNFSSFNPFSDIHEVVQNANSKPKVKSVGLDIILDLDYIMNNSDFQMQVPDPMYLCGEQAIDVRPKSLPNSALEDAAGSIKIGFIDSGGPFSGNELPATLYHDNYFDQFINGLDLGWDIFDWDAIPDDENGHGIHTGGIVALENLLGPEVNTQLKFYRAFNQEGTGSLGDVIRSIDRAVEEEIKIINCSFGYMIPEGVDQISNPPLREVIDVAEKQNVLFIAAAGNEYEDNDEAVRATYPASFDLSNIISVAAADCDGMLADFSNIGGSTVDLAAPGVNILSTYMGSKWAIKSGTSQAAPFVSYLAAILASLAPFDYEEVKCAILNGVKVNPDLSGLILSEGVVDGMGAVNEFMQGCAGSKLKNNSKGFVKSKTGKIKGLYPNPTQGAINVLYAVEQAGPVQVQIISVDGNLIHQQKEVLDIGQQTIHLQLQDDLPAGVYLLKVRDERGVKTEKIIKQ